MKYIIYLRGVAVVSQRKLNMGFTLFMVLLFILVAQLSPKLALVLGLGTALGFAMQKSRFCFAAAIRDPLLVGMTHLTQALILLIALSIAGFTLIVWVGEARGISYSLNVFPLGVHTLVGGVLFGIGMVLAGGCASGVLMRIGEGFGMQMLALGGLLIGALLGKLTVAHWRFVFGERPGIFLPDKIGWFGTLFLEFGVLFGLWMLARWWQRKQVGE